ncbi:MAG TPA: CHAD domain-containing protein [Solirubrobacteraceae bacterium]
MRAGTAIARAERDRRSRARRQRERQFALLPADRPAEGLRRIALGQLDLTLELLDGEIERERAATAVHDTRKALKRLRALMRLLEKELPPRSFAVENACLRDMARRLAAARDAEVMLGTLEQLLSRHPRKLGRRRSLARLRQQLAAERDRAAADAMLGDAAARRAVIEELRASRARVLQWRLPERPGMELASEGLGRIYRQGRKRHRRAARGRGERTRAMHEWRKRVKDLRHVAEMLDRRDPVGCGDRGRRGGTGRGRKLREAARIRRLAKRADALGEVLGEDHDLAVFAERIRSDRGIQLGRRARRGLLRSIRRRRRTLRRRALRDGARLYRRRPKAFVARVREAYARGARV